MLSDDLIHVTCFQPGKVGKAGIEEFVATMGPSVPRNALASGSGGVDEHPGLGPEVHRGLQPGSLAMGTRLLCANDSVKTPLSGRHEPVLMNG